MVLPPTQKKPVGKRRGDPPALRYRFFENLLVSIFNWRETIRRCILETHVFCCLFQKMAEKRQTKQMRGLLVRFLQRNGKNMYAEHNAVLPGNLPK